MFFLFSVSSKKPYKADFLPNFRFPSVEQCKAIIRELRDIQRMGNENIEKMSREVFEYQYNNFKKVCSENDEVDRQREGFIYIIKSRKYYKIGRSKKLQNRIKTYQTENPYRIKMIYQQEVKDTIRAERALLKVFADKKHKHRKEWFFLDDSDIERAKIELAHFAL